MSKQLHNNNVETLRLQSPEFLTGHRQAIIAHAVQNLSAHAQSETLTVEKTIPTPTEQLNHARVDSSQYHREAEQFKQETSVDRIMQDVDAIFEGQGNPLYDQETI